MLHHYVYWSKESIITLIYLHIFLCADNTNSPFISPHNDHIDNYYEDFEYEIVINMIHYAILLNNHLNLKLNFYLLIHILNLSCAIHASSQ